MNKRFEKIKKIKTYDFGKKEISNIEISTINYIEVPKIFIIIHID